MIDREQQIELAWQYQPNPSFYDEMMTADGRLRPHWRALADFLSQAGAAGWAARWREGQRLLHDHGVTYNVYDDPKSTDRPWPLDPIPLILDRKEWTLIEAAVKQRAVLLNAILADLYGPQRLLRDRLFPAELVYPHPAFLRPCHGVEVPGGIHLHLYAADLARSPDGQWWVLGDRTQAPSGAGYAVENRLVSTRMLPDLFQQMQVNRLASFFQNYRDMLRGMVPPNRENPRLVLLTPGPYNETYFEHAFLSRYLGFPLVEGGDLTVREGRVFLKTLGGLLPVDVVVRRQDDSFCDPLELREDSMLGVPGLLQALRARQVSVANALGSGLMESAAPSAFLPGLCRYILGEELKMPTVATWWCGQPGPFSYVVNHLNNLVIKPAFPQPGVQPIFGARLNALRRRELLDQMLTFPDRFVAQEQVSLSTAPVWRDGRLHPRHFVLRVYAVATSSGYEVMPGGLTRVTNSLDSLVVSMQRGGGSKDTWVLGDRPSLEFSLLRRAAASIAVSRATFDLPSRVADNLYWLGRYTERLEAALRICRALLRRLSQDVMVTAAGGLRVVEDVLLALGYIKDPAPLAGVRAQYLEQQLMGMMHDAQAKGPLAGLVNQIRRIAWLLRDRISVDAWRVLNRLERLFEQALPNSDPLRLSGAQEMADQGVSALVAFSGLVMESMTRGDGWRFLDLGRRIERASQMVDWIRGVSSTLFESEGGRLEALLDMADSSLTYRSRYLTTMQADLVLDLLLLDEASPRSLAFQLARICEHIEQLPETRSLVRRPAEMRLALALRNAVQLAQIEDLVKPGDAGNWPQLEHLLARLAADLRRLSETLTRVYFNLAVPSRQISAP